MGETRKYRLKSIYGAPVVIADVANVSGQETCLLCYGQTKRI